MIEPDARLIRGEARCSLWWTRTARLGNCRTGLIGEYAARSSARAVDMLSHAVDILAARGCGVAVGPMDGSVWDRYRFITARGLEPTFIMEPDNPDSWPCHFTAAGFAPVAKYYSALTSDLAQSLRGAETAATLERGGFTIRNLRMEDFDREVERLYPVAMAAFRRGFFFTSVDTQAFLARYRALRPRLLPQLLFIAERGAEPCGFLLALPDSGCSDRFVIRTLAVAPEYAGRGVGAALLERAHSAGSGCGFRRAIHALMHERNPSRRLSQRTARVFREYALFGHGLTATNRPF